MKARLVGLMMLCLGAAGPSLAAPKTYAWNTTVSSGAGGSHILGNKDAKVRLTQYVSYSCTFCSAFAIESEAPLSLVYVSSGKVSFEIRHFLINPIDLPVAMLVECGPPQRFFLNHAAFLRDQKRWRSSRRTFSSTQMERWKSGTLAQRNRAVANDLELYAFMEGRGFDRMETDRCLTDKAVADRITAQSDTAKGAGLIGVPSFEINGSPLPNVTNWTQLRPIIDKSL